MPEKEHDMFGGDDNNWIIWIIVLFLLLGNNGSNCGCDNGCGNGCNSGNGGCGGSDIILLIILLLIFSGSDGCFGNLFGSCAKE